MKEMKDMFSAGAFVWDVFIPQNPETGCVSLNTQYFSDFAHLSLKGVNLSCLLQVIQGICFS